MRLPRRAKDNIIYTLLIYFPAVCAKIVLSKQEKPKILYL